MSECIFCQIVSGDQPAEVVHEDADIIAFRDISPNAPVHLLVVPREHHPDIDSLADQNLMVRLMTTARKLGESHSSQQGYRVLVNSNKQADVDHIHFHVLGGLEPSEPIGGGGGQI